MQTSTETIIPYLSVVGCPHSLGKGMDSSRISCIATSYILSSMEVCHLQAIPESEFGNCNILIVNKVKDIGKQYLKSCFNASVVIPECYWVLLPRSKGHPWPENAISKRCSFPNRDMGRVPGFSLPCSISQTIFGRQKGL